jgi:signal transduction histidine kinase
VQRTLRSNLTLALAVALSVALAVLCSVVVSSRRSSFRATLDERLGTAGAAIIERILAEGLASATSSQLEQLVPPDGGHEFCALRDDHGGVLASWNVWRSEFLPPIPRSPDSGAILPSFETVEAGQARHIAGRKQTLRAATIPFRAEEREYFLQLAVRDRSWTHLLGTSVLLVSIAVLFVAVGAPLVALVITRRVTTPIHALAEIAKEVSPSNLGGRFELRTRDIELRRLQEELNGALQRLEEGYRAQAQFISNVAHELKTPIAALMADAQVSKLGRRTKADSQAFMNRAEEELRHLTSVIESFLLMARIETQQPRRDLVYVDDVVRRSARRCADATGKNGVPIELDLAGAADSNDPFVQGDAELLQAMVENLVRNAINHSPRGEPVVVSTRCENGTVRIVVRDRGPGIPEEFREKVFERGVRGPAGGGAGLGLSIASSVAKQHGGRVTLAENSEIGSTFVVTLPEVERKSVGVELGL